MTGEVMMVANSYAQIAIPVRDGDMPLAAT